MHYRFIVLLFLVICVPSIRIILIYTRNSWRYALFFLAPWALYFGAFGPILWYLIFLFCFDLCTQLKCDGSWWWQRNKHIIINPEHNAFMWGLSASIRYDREINIWHTSSSIDQWDIRVHSHDINQPITAWCKICDGGGEEGGMASV